MTMLRSACETSLAAAIAVAVGLGFAGNVAAQNYPVKPIKVVVPFAPGGPADVIGRIIGQQLNIILGQSLVVENRGGAGGTIGARFAAAAEPDGYTLMFANTSTLSINPALPVKTIAELIDYGKANPGKLSYSTPGVGTPPHMIGEMFKQRTGLDITHVPYKGGGGSTQDVCPARCR